MCQTFIIEKTVFIKTWIFLKIKFEEVKVQGMLEETFILTLSFSTVFRLRFPLLCFFVFKGFYQSFLGNEINFTDIMNITSNILAKN